MADITTKINGELTTLVDNGDGTYRIDLVNQEARRFVRGERDQINEALDRARDEKASLVQQRDFYAQQRTLVADRINAINAEIDELVANKDELTAFLTGQGDE